MRYKITIEVTIEADFLEAIQDAEDIGNHICIARLKGLDAQVSNVEEIK